MIVDPVSVGSYVALSIIENGGRYNIANEYWDEVDAAYHGWIERKINRVLALTSYDGSDVLLAASRISDLFRSTPETRERCRQLTEAEKAESGFAE